MANEFKVRKGLIVTSCASGSTVIDVQGTQGQLFSVTDSLEGSLFTVSDISGIPIVEVCSDNTVKMGMFGSEALIVSGSCVSLGCVPNAIGNVLTISPTTGLIQHRTPAQLFDDVGVSDCRVCISAGTSLISGGSFTLNQTSASTITLSHATYPSINVAATGANVFSCIISDATGHITTACTRTLTASDIGAVSATTFNSYTGTSQPILDSAVTGATNIGTGSQIFSSTSNRILQLRTLVGSGDTVISTVGNDIRIFTNIPATTYGTLNTTCTTALSTSASESFGAAICLHRISKTGCYSHLSGIPTIGDGTICVSASTLLSGGGSFTVNQTGASTINVCHSAITTTCTTTGHTTNYGESFTVVDEICTNNGHVTGYREKTVTMPDFKIEYCAALTALVYTQ